MKIEEKEQVSSSVYFILGGFLPNKACIPNSCIIKATQEYFIDALL